ncbi:MAG TPA: hypothetical protein VK111_14510 [Virgibacillus sp.]|nr:hypothetical protein [Virgibacillus sp.]
MNKREAQNLDREWIDIIKSVKMIGLMKEEVRSFQGEFLLDTLVKVTV